MVAYREHADGIAPGQLEGFFVGWPRPPTPERHLEHLRRSAHVVVAVDEENGRVVGFVTAISDGVLTAFVPLLEVLPEYRRRGIASELVRRLLARLEGLYSIDLACDEELVPLYERLGLGRVGVAMGTRNRDAL